MKWKIVYYRECTKQPVKQYFDNLDSKTKAKILRNLQLLAEFGPELGWPYISKIRDKIWELRTTHGGNQYRILFALLSGNEVLLLHGIHKKTRKLLANDINIASNRLERFLTSRKDGG